MECPFCRSEMEHGVVKIRTMEWWSTSLTWKADHERGDARRLMKAGRWGGRGREGSYCYGCDAVVMDPVPPDWPS